MLAMNFFQHRNTLPPLASAHLSPPPSVEMMDTKAGVDVLSFIIPFAAGACYGATSVVVGQPLDTVKTLHQTTMAGQSSLQIAKELFKTEGLRGLYRGSLPPLIGGSLFRSAQFGCYEAAKGALERNTEDHRLFGFTSTHTVLAGAAGGLGRGVFEGIFDHAKIRLQLKQPWSMGTLVRDRGVPVTLFRNVFLFGSFVVYIDLSKEATGGKGLGPFWTGAVCASAAWLTIWPLDVLKSVVTAQNAGGAGVTTWGQMRQIYHSGHMTRGLGPGLARSVVANGCAMTMYKLSETAMNNAAGRS